MSWFKPRRRSLRYAVRLAMLASVVLTAWTTVYLTWNDDHLAHSINGWVSGSMRGHGGASGRAFVIERVHYPYWCPLRSLAFGGTCPFEAGRITIYDESGAEVIRSEDATGTFHIGEVVWNMLLSQLHFKPFDLELHFDKLHVHRARADIHLAATGEVNLVQAFTTRPEMVVPPVGGMRIRVEQFDFDDVDFAMAMPGWRGEVAHARGASAVEGLRFSTYVADNPDKDKLAFEVAIQSILSDKGLIVLGSQPEFRFPLEKIDVRRFAALEPRSNYLDFGGTADSLGAHAKFTGSLERFFSKPGGPSGPGADLALDFTDGHGLIGLLPLGDLLEGNPSGAVHIHGTFDRMLIDGRVKDGGMNLAGVKATAVGVDALHLEPGSPLHLGDAHALMGGGSVAGSVDVDFAKLQWTADLCVKDVDPDQLEPVIPHTTGIWVRGALSGCAHLWSNFALHPDHILVQRIKGHLVRHPEPHDKLPIDVDIAGQMETSPEKFRLDGVSVSGDGMTASVVGTYDPRRLTTHVNMTLDAKRAAAFLKRTQLAIPNVDVGGVHARTVVDGSILEPHIEGTATLTDVGRGDLKLARMDANILFEHGHLDARGLTSAGLGGVIGGDVALDIYNTDFLHLRPVPRLRASLGLDKLRSHVMLKNPNVHGEISGSITLDGPLARPHGTATLALPQLDLYDDFYSGGTAALAFTDDGVRFKSFALDRDGGGRLGGDGTLGYDGKLDVRVNADDFPLNAIPGMRDLTITVAGLLKGTIHLGGTLAKVEPSGVIEMVGAKLREFALGDGSLELKPEADGIHLIGDFFHQFRVNGVVKLTPALDVNVKVAFDDLPLEKLIPEMGKLADVKGITSGVVVVKFVAGSAPLAVVTLSKLVLALTRSDSDDDSGHPEREEFINQGPIVLTTDFKTLNFLQARLRSPAGEEFVVDGRVSEKDTNLHVQGDLQLQLLEYFTTALFDHTDGRAHADLTLLGAAKKPRVTGRLDLNEASIKPRGAEKAFRTSGELEFKESAISLNNLTLQLDDAKPLVVNGALELVEWEPGKLNVSVDGELPASIAEWDWFYRDYVSDTSGRLELHALIKGTWGAPLLEQGSIDFHDLAFRLRKAAHDIRIPSGTIRVDEREKNKAQLGTASEPIRGRLDDTGDLTVSGQLTFSGLAVNEVKLHVTGENLEWGVGRVYNVTISLPGLDVTGNWQLQQLRVAGDVTVVSARYYQDYEVSGLVIRPRTVEDDAPFYQGIPQLERLGLALNVRSAGPLAVKDNVANLAVSIASLRVLGTLSQPTLDGEVHVEEGGTFKIPLLGADFITDKGSVFFDGQKNFPDETPRLDIHAYADWNDRYEQLHHILLNVRGTYRQPDLDLTSTDGWDKNQVLYALVAGGSPDDVRRSFQNDPKTAGGPGLQNSVFQHATGEILSTTATNPLKEAFKLDTLRIELGYVKACLFNQQHLVLCGTGEGQLSPTSNIEARGELKLSDGISVGASMQHLEQSLETSQDVVNRGRFLLRWRLPIR